MSSCLIKRVKTVDQHPEKEHLNIVCLDDESQLVSMKLEDGTSRYKIGDLVVHIPHGAILPETLMRRLDVWDEEKGCGLLNGAQKNKIKRSKFSGIMSEGMLLPADETSITFPCTGMDASSVLGVEF